MNAAILTAGCRLNQSESDALRGLLTVRGVRMVSNPAQADVCFVNTCSVTAAADRSSVQLVRQACRTMPRPRVVVLGCLAERTPEVLRAISGVSEIWNNARKQERLSGVCPVPTRSRALLKVQDGCDRDCCFCVVPLLRGRPVSIPADKVAKQFEQLVSTDGGFGEVVLTGLNLGLYRDEAGIDLAGLLEMLLERSRGVSREVRIRIGSIEPDTVTERLIDVLAARQVAPHFHLALQSGDDRVLSLMKRRYDTAGFVGLVAAIRRSKPDANIGFDIIAGLPGEDERSFERTSAFVRELVPGYLHVFSFSPRPGTPAAGMDAVPPRPERKRRVRALMELSANCRREYQKSFVGVVRSAVVESAGTALTDNYLRLALEADYAAVPRSIVRLLIVDEQGRLMGRFRQTAEYDVAGSPSRLRPSTKEAV